MKDFLPFWIAFVPLAIYVAFWALIHLRRRPTILSGTVDAFFLGFGLSGFFLVGIGPAFIPIPSLMNGENGWISWSLLVVLFILCCFEIATCFPPKVVIYHFNPNRVRELIEERILHDPTFSKDASVTEDFFFLPELKITARLVRFPTLRNSTIALIDKKADPKDVKRFFRRLKEVLRSDGD